VPATLTAPAFGFSVLDAVPEDRANAGNVANIRSEFRTLKDLGINVVVQSFASGSTESDWQAYLDAAAEEGLLVAGWFRTEPPVWNGSGFDLGINKVFLSSMKNHPALYAFFLIDEPFHSKHGWEITAERLQLLYRQAKDIAPDVLMGVQFSREIKLAEDRQNPNYGFRSGMCDICVIGGLDFRNYGNGNQFYRDDMLANQRASRAVIKREDPNARIWATIQVFGSAQGRSSYYMPSPAELQEVVDLLFSSELQATGQLDGVIWQQWMPYSKTGDAAQYTLSDPQFEEQRNIVKNTAEHLGLPPSH
jgi:hypothetical protein